MSKIRNSVYGLALGDASGYPVEFSTFENAVQKVQENEGLPIPELLVTDDTQMSIALIQGFQAFSNESKVPKVVDLHHIEPHKKSLLERFRASFSTSQVHPETQNEIEAIDKLSIFDSIPYIGVKFVQWSASSENCRAPGLACMAALDGLSAHPKFQTISPSKTMDVSGWINLGMTLNQNSKGSGTVMRSPWIAFIADEIEDKNFHSFCRVQSQITHGHPTALEASYLTALITRELYRGTITPSGVAEFAVETIRQHQETEYNLGWRELEDMMSKVIAARGYYGMVSRFEEDPSEVIGGGGSADDVLGTALLLIDTFPDDPNEVIDRAALNSGDTDTIAAVAGGIIGAAFDGDIWGSRVDVIERNYIERLEGVIDYLESVN